MIVCREKKESTKTLAINSSIFNSIVVLVALRFTLQQPDADLASAAALAVLYFTPVPFVLMFIIERCRKILLSHFDRTNMEKEQKRAMLKSFSTITQNAFHMGGLDATEVQMAVPSNLPDENGDKRKLLKSQSQSLGISPHIVTNSSFTDITPEENNLL
ncbi:hypothetical protein EB796_010158 [Bugula neritina]|uniref:Uncharacterized protein n=1 Tax=Bugula neritina TaxID=10212 RepID=A0A7J7K1Q4_BUGNE|nr:hypothetical protein EB796_010158 [Bugula neritina]